MGSYCLFYTEIKSRDSEIKSRRGAGNSRGICGCWFVLLFRTLPPAAPPASPVARALAPARGMLGRVLYAAAFFLLLIYTMDSQPTDKVEGVGDDFVRGGQDKTQVSVPQPQAAEQPFKPSAPPRRHCQRPQLVKGKSPQGPRVTVQIEQYFLYSAAQLTSSSSSSTATASRLSSSMLPRQPRRKPSWKPASTPPRRNARAV